MHGSAPRVLTERSWPYRNVRLRRFRAVVDPDKALPTESGVDAGSRRYYVAIQDRLIGSCSARSALLVRGHKRIPTVTATMIQTLLISRTAIPTPTI